jgi:outer membrane protein
VGLSISDPLEISDFSTKKVLLDSVEIYKTAALQSSPEWHSLQLQQKQALLHQKTTLLKNLPTVNADLYYGWDTNPPLSKKNNGLQGMLRISLPLWHWGVQKMDYQIAGLRLRQIEQTQIKLRKQILQKVINAYNEARLQQTQILAMTEGKNEAEQAVKMARLGYKEGSITNLELINTQKIFTRAKIEHLAALYNFYIAKAGLLRSTGMLREDLTSWIWK